MEFGRAIEEAAKAISFSEEKTRLIASSLSGLREKRLFSESGSLEERLFLPVQKARLEGRIAGIDSGFMAKELSSVDLMLVRAIAAVFTYRENRLVKSDYWPSPASLPEPFVFSHGEFDELGVSVSLLRLKEEVSKAIEAIKRFSPQYCFLDGSIVPQYPDKPRSNSGMREEYLETISLFEKLYSTAQGAECGLIACVEDSRGTRFRDIISGIAGPKESKAESLGGTSDSLLLSHLLSKGERTTAFPYSADTNKHPILADFPKEWAKKVHAFYLKPSLLDAPLRVEFLSSPQNAGKEASKISPIVLTLSSLHKEYAFPSILIEADLRARLRQEEISLVLDRVFDKVGRKGSFLKRRERRPFR